MGCKDWKKVTIGDLFYVRNGASIPSKSFHDNSDLVNNYEAFKMGHIAVGGGLRTDPKRSYVTRSEKLNKYLLEKDDIVMGMTDMKDCVVILGVPAIIKESNRYLQNQRVASLRKKDEVSFDIQFVYYQMLTPDYLKPLQSRANRGVQVNLTTNHIKDSTIYLPPIETQQKIVRILSALDQKIELNNLQNSTLFDSIRSIFRNKYYQKGNDCSLSDYILTEVNGDWGKDKKEDETKEAYCIRGADIPDMEYGNKGNAPRRYILEKRLEKKSLSEDDIIIEISGGSPTQSTGRTAYITQKILDMYDAPLLCTNFCKAIKVKNKIFAPFIYMYLKSLYEDDVLFNWENGTTGIKNLALSSLLSSTKVQSLNDKEARKFYDQFYAIVNKISKNSAENMILIQMRDTLLPKLMSGEINPEGIKE